MKLIYLTAAIAFLGTLLSARANAGEAWDCIGVGTGVGRWEIQGNELVEPPADIVPTITRIPIVKNDSKAVVAFLDSKYDRFGLVMIDKHTLVIKVVGIGINSDFEDHLLGKCTHAGLRRK